MRETIRIRATIDKDIYMQIVYWAKERDMSINEYLAHAVEKTIDYECKNYDLPTLEIARLNQLIDVITCLSANTKALEETIISGFDSLLGLTRGDNYLLNSEDDYE